MPPLAELQRQFARAVMMREVPAGLFTGRVPVAQALSIHRDTIIGALTNALRLSFPTVVALVGDDFFDHACSRFVPDNLPDAACLSDYGAGFAGFLAASAPGLSYLPDVARLDHAIEAALRAPGDTRRFTLDGTAAIALPAGLTVLALHHPADEIRAALGDDSALANIAMATAERFILVWRKGDDAAVLRVRPASGRFLMALLAGGDADAAFGAAIAGTTQAEAVSAIQADIFAAAFCTILETAKEPMP